MNAPLIQLLKERLNQRREEGEYRTVHRVPKDHIDFCSNDYLGLSSSGALLRKTEEKFSELLSNTDNNQMGATGSRLISGETSYAHALENTLAEFYNAESALLFPTGYTANLGLITTLGASTDVHFIYDEQAHASIRDGLRLARASASKFKHNDLISLEEELEKTSKTPVILVEALYSMDGDLAPLEKIVPLVKEYKASLIVDEAHSSGLYGTYGEGLTDSLSLSEHIFARVHTFGKAHGAQGGVIAGPSYLRESLINYARSFIYTTGTSLVNLASVDASYALIKEAEKERRALQKNIAYFCDKATKFPKHFLACSQKSPIQSIYLDCDEKRCSDHLHSFTKHLKDNKVYTVPIFSPTVPKGKERIRISLHSYNSIEEIDHLFSCIKEFVL